MDALIDEQSVLEWMTSLWFDKNVKHGSFQDATRYISRYDSTKISSWFNKTTKQRC